MGIFDKLFGKGSNRSKTTPKPHAPNYNSNSQQERPYYEKQRKEEEYSRKKDETGEKHKEIRAPVIGIDLGTSNSSVAVIDTKTGRPVTIPITGTKIFPSCVAFTKDGEILIGDRAKRQAITNPEGTVMAIKRKIGSDYRVMIHQKEYSPQLIVSLIFRKIKQDAEAFLGVPVSGAVVTVPAYFDDCQRQATKDACTAAGLYVIRILNEPTAAALSYGLLAYGLYGSIEERFMVIHFGGGTVDVTIMDYGQSVFEVFSTSGDTQLGGIDMDNRIIDYILTKKFEKKTRLDIKEDKMAMERLREAVEAAKIELSNSTISNINIPYIAIEGYSPKDLDMTLTREELEELASPIIEKLKIPISVALEDARLTPKDISSVILVGEPTHMPIVRDTIKKIIGKEIKYNILPKEYVAMGAAIQAGILRGQVKEEIVLLDVTPLTLSIETLGGVATRLIERNTTIPTKKSQIFSTAAENQTSVEIHVTQGERPMAVDNTSVGRFLLDGIPPAPRGIPQIEVTFDIDTNGILNVAAEDMGTGKKQEITITSSIKLSKTEIDKMRRETERFAEKNKMKREKAEIRNNAESLIYTSERTVKDLGDKISKEQKVAIENSINALRKALESNDLERLKRRTEKLKSVLQMEVRSDEEKVLHAEMERDHELNNKRGGERGSEYGYEQWRCPNCHAVFAIAPEVEPLRLFGGGTFFAKREPFWFCPLCGKEIAFLKLIAGEYDSDVFETDVFLTGAPMAAMEIPLDVRKVWIFGTTLPLNELPRELIEEYEEERNIRTYARQLRKKGISVPDVKSFIGCSSQMAYQVIITLLQKSAPSRNLHVHTFPIDELPPEGGLQGFIRVFQMKELGYLPGYTPYWSDEIQISEGGKLAIWKFLIIFIHEQSF